MDLFERHLSHIIDGTLGKRSVSIGYDYSEIIRSLMCAYFCGGSCVEDVSNHLMGHLSLHPLSVNIYRYIRIERMEVCGDKWH